MPRFGMFSLVICLRTSGCLRAAGKRGSGAARGGASIAEGTIAGDFALVGGLTKGSVVGNGWRTGGAFSGFSLKSRSSAGVPGVISCAAAGAAANTTKATRKDAYWVIACHRRAAAEPAMNIGGVTSRMTPAVAGVR